MCGDCYGKRAVVDWNSFRRTLIEEEWQLREDEEVDTRYKKMGDMLKKSAKIHVGKRKNKPKKGNVWRKHELKKAWKIKETNRKWRRGRNTINISTQGGIEELNRLKEEALRARMVFKKMVHEAIRKSEKVKIDKLIAEGEEGGKEWFNFLDGRRREATGGINELEEDGVKITG